MEVMTLTAIILIAVFLLFMLGVLILVGLRRSDAKKVSFTTTEEPKELTQQEKSGNYQAHGGFNFAPAKADDKEPAVLPGQELKAEPSHFDPVPLEQEAQQQAVQEPVKEPEEPTAETEQAAAEQVASKPVVAEPVATESAVTVPPASEKTDASQVEDEAAEETTKESAEDNTDVADSQEEEAAEVSTANAVVVEELDDELELEEVTASEVIAETPPAETPEEAPSKENTSDEGTTDAAKDEDETEDDASEPGDEHKDDAEEANEAADSAQTQVAAAEQALEETPVPEAPAQKAESQKPESTAQQQAPKEDIAPAAGRLGRLRGRLSKSQNVFGQSVLGMLSAGDLDDDAWEEIEDTLLMADLGTTITMDVVEKLREKIAERGVSSEEEARAMLRETLIEACKPELDRSIKAMPYEGKPAVIMLVGVNGTGKTTTTGKLARVLVSMGHKVLLGAADTFRAAAADQLETWGRRVGADTVRGAEGADPASVAFDAVAQGVDTQVDVVLVDTAGRLHTSVGLMDQLGKVKRVVEKKAQVDEVLLVLDATIGQNGLMQARTFRDVVDITGVVLTKLDGTAKGGIVFQVQEELGVPVKLVGLGEGADDLAPFEVESFIDALLG
ncbi:signal recognition particle-docking protein FtsY [Corynebacterium durum]|uniref:signal recognition particle-docking protein FtsY n=1 Tax=Corynebacterium durum TaxID=61592 RepID=UPI0028E30925|nr:signal recognition particle-docking protein FtsY [Corynebacterium durum]